jgi:hypothetical protein
MSKYIYWIKKRLVWGCFRIEEERGKNNETGLKEERGYRNVKLQVLSIYAIARSLSLFVFTYLLSNKCSYSTSLAVKEASEVRADSAP